MKKIVLKFKKILFRAVPFLCCFMIFVSCLVVPAFAYGIYDEDATVNKYFSIMHGEISIRFPFDLSDNPDYLPNGTLVDQVNLPMVYGQMVNSGVNYVQETGSLYSASTWSGSSGYDWSVDYDVYTKRLDGAFGSAYLSAGTDFFTIDSQIEFSNFSEDMGQRLPIGEYTYNFAPFVCALDPTGVMYKLFEIYDRGDVFVDGYIWVYRDTGGFEKIHWSGSTTIGGTPQNIYDKEHVSWMSLPGFPDLNGDYGLMPGNPFLVTDLKIRVVPDVQSNVYNSSVEYRCAAGAFNRNNPSTLNRDSVESFFGDPRAIPVPLEGEAWASWLAGIAHSFFNVELFGVVSFGDILFTIVAVGVVFWLLKMFAGG